VNEVIFVRGTTEAINLVAKSWGAQHIGEGDEIIVSHLEHHANIVPWQQLASAKGAKLRVIPVDDSGQVLLCYGMQQLATIPGVRLIGTAADKASVMSFVLDGYTTDEVGKALNEEGIAVRTGHHCAQPILRRFGLETTVRPSLAFYNTFDEIDLLVAVVRRLAGRRRTH
jgi:selenocysteine lyase/cysteine desulfurase